MILSRENQDAYLILQVVYLVGKSVKISWLACMLHVACLDAASDSTLKKKVRLLVCVCVRGRGRERVYVRERERGVRERERLCLREREREWLYAWGRILIFYFSPCMLIEDRSCCCLETTLLGPSNIEGISNGSLFYRVFQEQK